MQPFANATLPEILRVNGINMSAANRCIERHRKIVEAIEKLRRSTGAL